MKSTILIVLICLSTTVYGQKLTVTPNGLKDANDTEKTFVVINAEGKTAKELYDNAIKYINKNYKSPDDVIKGKAEGEFLRFDTFTPTLFFIKDAFSKTPFSAKYTTELSFKDGKVKYEVIALNMYNAANIPFTFTGGTFDFCIFNKKGDLKRLDTKTEIETYFNGQINTIAEFLQGKGNNDNW